MPIRLEELNVEPVGGNFGGDLVNNPIPEEIANGPAYVYELSKRFLMGIPWYEWRDIWDSNDPDVQETVHYILISFLNYVTQLPEFQLA